MIVKVETAIEMVAKMALQTRDGDRVETETAKDNVTTLTIREAHRLETTEVRAGTDPRVEMIHEGLEIDLVRIFKKAPLKET